MSGAHEHWVESLDTPSHATKGKKFANGTGSLITLNCGKGVNHGVNAPQYLFCFARSFIRTRNAETAYCMQALRLCSPHTLSSSQALLSFLNIRLLYLGYTSIPTSVIGLFALNSFSITRLTW